MKITGSLDKGTLAIEQSMTGTYSFLIKAKCPLVELLEGADDFFRYLAKDVILTAQYETATDSS